MPFDLRNPLSPFLPAGAATGKPTVAPWDAVAALPGSMNYDPLIPFSGSWQPQSPLVPIVPAPTQPTIGAQKGPTQTKAQPQGALSEAARQAEAQKTTVVAQGGPTPPTGLPGDSRGISEGNNTNSPLGALTRVFDDHARDWDPGTAMEGAGIALMSLDNPDAAKEFAKYAILSSRQPDKHDVRVDLASGRSISTNLTTGKTTVQQVTDPAPKPLTHKYIPETGTMVSWDDQGNVQRNQKVSEPPPRPMPETAQRTIQDNQTKADSALQTALKNQEFIKLLREDKMDLSALGRAGSEWQLLMGSSDERTRNAAKFQAHINELRNSQLLDAKGTQTEGDAQRALESILPGISGLDNKTVATLLRGANDGLLSAYERNHRYNLDSYRRYKDRESEDYYTKQFESQRKQYHERKTEMEQGWEEWMNSPAPKPPANPYITGQNPARAQAPQRKETFLEFLERQDREKAKGQ